MLPPVLEIYVVWHPDDLAGAGVAQDFVQHFHGTRFGGLVGGAIEVYVRSVGWRGPADAPRPLPFPGVPVLNGVVAAQLVAVVPVLGTELAAVVESGTGPWHDYAIDIVTTRDAHPECVGVFPVVVDRAAVDGTKLNRIFGRFHRIGRSAPVEQESSSRCRDLAQGIAQWAGDPRLTVFISHTSRTAPGDEPQVASLIELLRSVIGQTCLDDFFDTNDLQPGVDWDKEIRSAASTGALLAIRTDLYASREWCQREVLCAKCAGIPVVVLDALRRGEERGSFLLDHVPRVPVRHHCDDERRADILTGLNLLVDECLKGVLWRRQRELAQGRADLEVAWWAPHAPEPATLVAWLAAERTAGRLTGADSARILHPDPPLGTDEKKVLEQMAKLGGLAGGLDIMTPRMLAARGG